MMSHSASSIGLLRYLSGSCQNSMTPPADSGGGGAPAADEPGSPAAAAWGGEEPACWETRGEC